MGDVFGFGGILTLCIIFYGVSKCLRNLNGKTLIVDFIVKFQLSW